MGQVFNWMSQNTNSREMLSHREKSEGFNDWKPNQTQTYMGSQTSREGARKTSQYAAKLEGVIKK